MKAMEWLTILLGLVGGYWLVSRLMSGKAEPPPVPPPARDHPYNHFGTAAREAPHNEAPPPPPSPPSPPPHTPAGPQPWHEVLGVPRHASRAEIKTAYRRRMQQYHPDKVAHLGPELRETAERMSRLINEAYETAIGER